MKCIQLFLLKSLFLPSVIFAKFLLFDEKALIEMRHAVHQEHPAFAPFVIKLIQEADSELNRGPYSVMEKNLTPPSGDKHDYMTLARYSWPNQNGGIPYVRRDCEVNPDIFKPDYDYAKKNQLVRGCMRLCLAYYLTQNEVYAAHASLLIKTWFLHPTSRMNPNLCFAQIEPGITNNSPFGIIETHTFPFLFEALNFLEGSSFWTDSDMMGVEKWIGDYLKWLLISPQGIMERQTLNNHASWYDMQVVFFALFINLDEFAAEYMKTFTCQKLRNHFAYDYSQPHEMIRKKNFFYSLFNLQALFHCALLGERLGLNLWEIEKKGEGTLRKGLDFLLPYVEDGRKWRFGETDPSDFIEMASLLLIADRVYPGHEYLSCYKRLENLTHNVFDDNRQVPFSLFKFLYPQSLLATNQQLDDEK